MVTWGKEVIPNRPEPLGKEVDKREFVDSDYATNKGNRRSRTGYVMFLNNSLTLWLSKLQGSIETSVFGLEFVAMKQLVDALKGLRHKLRMMGVPLSGLSLIYGDNLSVMRNSSLPESTLNKKLNSICYHFVRESVAKGMCLVSHMPSIENPSEMCTKVLPGGERRDGLIDVVLHDLVDYEGTKKGKKDYSYR